MDYIRKKELTEQYKQMRPMMGIYIIGAKVNNKCLIEATPDLRGRMNGAKARLGFGSHPNLELQKEWKELGPDNFTIEVLEYLDYDKDEAKTDYREDLALLQLIWEERLAKDNKEFYKKRM